MGEGEMKITAEEIRALAERAKQANQMELAGILWCVTGTIRMESEGMLLKHLESFTSQQLQLIDEMEEQLRLLVEQPNCDYRSPES
jgi:hypothetical protein